MSNETNTVRGARTSDEVFLRAFMAEHTANPDEPSIARIATSLGLSETSVRQRATVLRKTYPDLPKFKRGSTGPRKRDPNLLANIVAELQGDNSDSDSESDSETADA